MLPIDREIQMWYQLYGSSLQIEVNIVENSDKTHGMF